MSARRQAISSVREHTLAGEHEVLLRDVQRRADAVVALLDARTWPSAELGTLTAFLRAEVFRQASDEEALLYPGEATAGPFAELSADHALLYTLCARLEAEIRTRQAEQARRVSRWLHGFDSARFGLSHAVSGDGHSLLYVSRRSD
ncbi:MAG TPA: hemerythrin domain-containing protein [Jatrophihabitantaceae bacterium]|nr:hemerythrin domain-containing protein [Jatrophihabitantaceae bacterium]